ncbi:hypothetical protein QVD17_02596 [Tagetes erecta]|uniref:Phosphoinositide phospholipase C n=1 Tax=Tagetes erecta TaxID=13708 RepID=A0AAD8LE84_TARER|nr:hypothetical protein QVD17_02596 [Tagetes erecta]
MFPASAECDPSTSSSFSIQWSQPFRHIEFPEILSATYDFDESLVIGKGGFGKVYRGNILIGDTLVVAAIKRLDPESSQGPDEFWAEVETLSMVRHHNIVPLIGYCIHEQEKILVYEYMSNGTLDDNLHKGGAPLSWLQRLKICVGAAHGLRYLHNDVGVDSGIIHRDFKSSNILLHETWTAKITDFGLSKTCPTNQPSTHVSTIVKGTYGYFDPSYYQTGKLTRKSDVYAFGVVLLEVLCRRRAVEKLPDEEWRSLATWAQDSIKEGNLKQIIDSDIRGEISPKCLKEFVRITERCLQENPEKRPTIAGVVVTLESVLALQEKFNKSLQPTGSRTIFGRMVDMFPFPSNGENYDHFRRFLEDDQGLAVSLSDADLMLDQILHKRHPHHFLFSTELNPPIRSQVHQDMSAPLSHYFIYTSHNSYLTGNQLSSNCSQVPIIKALRLGVRVIELDLWPNSSKSNVHVLHGRTLTTPVKLMDCLKAIKEYAFVASPYPVTITLEDHLTPDLQAKVAQMVTETFGSMLCSPESVNLEELTPENLKYRILISTKSPKEYLETDDVSRRMSSQKSQVSDVDDDAWSEDESYNVCCTKILVEIANLLKAKKSPSSPVDKQLIAIHAGKPKNGLQDVLKVEKDTLRRLSLAEQALQKATENIGQDVVRFTQKNILRIYPKGTHITSSNYNLLTGWQYGAQMVAFNMQGYGRSLWAMHGMFRANGGCGYVKKPDFLMRRGPKNEVFNPKEKLEPKTSLKVKLYMGDGWHLDFKKNHFDNSPPGFFTRL